MSSLVPKVAKQTAWVSPRANTAEPWARGRKPTSLVRVRIASKSRPSRRLEWSRTRLRMASFWM